jgi:hypothetical protein
MFAFIASIDDVGVVAVTPAVVLTPAAVGLSTGFAAGTTVGTRTPFIIPAGLALMALSGVLTAVGV